ncbi:MAG: FkbM family methyltransferase [Deltaproteobacteria bacterium]
MFRKLRECLKPGDDVIDVGANFGFHSLFAAKMLGPRGRVVAFEPVPANITILKRNVRLNGYQDTIAIQEYAVSDSPENELSMGVHGSGSDVTAAIITAKAKGGITVCNTRLDGFGWPTGFSPKLIKIDIEGAELCALRGGARLLEDKHPALLLEVHGALLPKYGDSFADLEAFLHELDYKLAARADVAGSLDGCWHALYTWRAT